MKKIVIVTGGRVSKDFVKKTLETYSPSVLIASDRGIMVLNDLNFVPDYLVGDFDSGESFIIEKHRAMFEREGKPIIRSFQPEKDETDTELALSLALGLLPDEILILGATGTRLDHTMANVGLLAMALEKGVRAYICDEYNKIGLYDETVLLKKRKNTYPFFSLLAFGGKVEGLNIRGAKYPLSDFTLSPESPLCISNECLSNEVQISFKRGRLLLFQTADEALEQVF